MKGILKYGKTPSDVRTFSHLFFSVCDDFRMLCTFHFLGVLSMP